MDIFSDAVLLSRIQFALTVAYHFIFVPLSIGLALILAINETKYFRSRTDENAAASRFWVKIFTATFVVGVATGITMEFSFGTNWADYARFVGDIFGAPLAFEALMAFFVESTFIGLWMFTWDRVKKGLHLFFIWMVFIGTTVSALWILTANSFMQHPVGYTIKNGRAEMVNFGALLANKQLLFEYGHVVLAALLTGATVITGLAAFQLLKKKRTVSDVNKKIYHKTMRMGMWMMLIFSLGTILVGDLQMKYLVKEQPMKFAATEAVYTTTGKKAPWSVVALVDPKTHKTEASIDIPDMLSLLTYGKTTGSVTGMKEINAQLEKKYGTKIGGQKVSYYVPVNTLFWSFRVMVGFGSLLFLVSLCGLIATRRGRTAMYEKRWVMWLFGLLTFSPFLANTTGWMITEFGRYPWTVYGLFTIAQSVSPNVSVTSLLISNIVYFLLFTGLAAVMIALVCRELRHDPNEVEEGQLEKLTADPFAKGAF